MWFDQGKNSTLLAPEVALVVRDKYPQSFNDVHIALFAARHDGAADIRDRDVISWLMPGAMWPTHWGASRSPDRLRRRPWVGAPPRL